MSYSRRLRRDAHRAARTPRAAWLRVSRYKQVPTRAGSIFNFTIPMSEDAPYEERDALFWDWIALTLVVGS